MRRIDPGSDLGRELMAFEDARRSALIAADAIALGRLLGEELQHIHSSGQVHSKAEFIAHVLNMGGFLSIERGPLAIYSDDQSALITGQTINKVRRLDSGEIVELDGFGTVVANRGGDGWQVLLSQITLARRG